MNIKSLKVLIIDDFEEDLMLCDRALRKCKTTKYETFQEYTSDQVMLAIAENSPDCVLVDYFMPEQNGLEVLKNIRAKFPFLPVIIMTGQVNERIAVAAMQAGAQNYISKSMLTPESLDRVVNQAVEHCMMQKCMFDQRNSLEIFTRALAHDLKEPVRSIMSFAELIDSKENLSPAGKQYFDYIKNASERMAKLIDMVHLYTRLDNPIPARKEIFHLAEVIGEAKENLTKLIAEKQANITMGNMPTIYANKIQMLQLFQNLIGNALKYNEEKVEIDIAAEEYSDSWLISVNDNGIGIDESDHEKIFEAFKRLESNDTSGNGMGLAIAKKIVESHDGKIWCKSIPGRGSTFNITLPKLVEEPLKVVSDNSGEKTKTPLFSIRKSETTQESQSVKANVLLVDDQDADVMITKFYLFEQPNVNCNITVANSGKEAINIINKFSEGGKKFDLVLLDINLPGSSGFDLLKKARESSATAESIIIMCSGSAYDKDIDMSKLLGASGYMIKPVRFEKMQTVINESNVLTLSKKENNYIIERVA